MRLFSLFLLLALAGCNGNGSADSTPEKDPANAALAPSKHSATFNSSVGSALQSYYDLTASFVAWDSAAVPARARMLGSRVNSISLSDLKEDTATAADRLASVRKNIHEVATAPNLESSRRALNVLTDNFFGFLNVVHYDREKVYLQECPMAFNDEEAAVWLSPKDTILNPYLGLHHPRYSKGMLNCGDNKAVMNYTGGK